MEVIWPSWEFDSFGHWILKKFCFPIHFPIYMMTGEISRFLMIERIFSNRARNIQLGVFVDITTFMAIAESPSISKNWIPLLIHSNRPITRALNFAILLVSGRMGWEVFHLTKPSWSFIMHHIPGGPGLPLEAPSKFNFNHPCLGGAKATWFLFWFKIPKWGGICSPFHLRRILSSQSINSFLKFSFKASL